MNEEAMYKVKSRYRRHRCRYECLPCQYDFGEAFQTLATLDTL